MGWWKSDQIFLYLSNKEIIMHTVRYICDLNVFFFFSFFHRFFLPLYILFIMDFTMSNYINIIRLFSKCPCRGWRIQEESICVLTDLYSLIFHLFVYIRIRIYIYIHSSNFICNNTIALSMCAIIFFARSLEYIPFPLALRFKLLSPSPSLFQSGRNLSSSSMHVVLFSILTFLVEV